jgi:hypothetical protein
MSKVWLVTGSASRLGRDIVKERVPQLPFALPRFRGVLQRIRQNCIS